MGASWWWGDTDEGENGEICMFERKGFDVEKVREVFETLCYEVLFEKPSQSKLT